MDEANELPRLGEKKRSGKVRRYYHCPSSRTSAARGGLGSGTVLTPLPKAMLLRTVE